MSQHLCNLEKKMLWLAIFHRRRKWLEEEALNMKQELPDYGTSLVIKK